MGEFFIRLYEKGLEHAIRAGSLTLRNLMVQTAASIIDACRSYPRDGSAPVNSCIGSILTSRLNWTSNVFTNALQAQAALVYAYVEAMLKLKMNRAMLKASIEETEAELFAQALEQYQHLKTDICKQAQKEHGKNWGTATEFFKKDWTDLNEKFLALFKR